MRLLQTNIIALILFWNTFAGADSTTAAPKEKPYSPLTIAVKTYNNFKSANRLFLAMRVDANASDREFLDDLIGRYGSVQLPRVTNHSDESLSIQGLDHPLKVVNLNAGKFSYDGTTIDLSGKKGIAISIDELQKVLFPQKSALMEWVLPSAHADLDPMVMMSAVMGVGGLGTMMSSCGGDTTSADVGCGIGGFMTGFGVTSLIAELSSSQYPQQVMCPPGTQSMVISNPAGNINTLTYVPGVGYTTARAFGQVPMPTTQYLSQQSYTTVCSNPGTLIGLNNAYQAPYYPQMGQLPMTALPPRPYGSSSAPIVLPYGRMPSSTSSLSPTYYAPMLQLTGSAGR